MVRDRLAKDQRVREALLPTWGPLPSWAKENGPRPISARLETAATNGMFRSSSTSARALVPMTGYFEWQEAIENGKRVKTPATTKRGQHNSSRENLSPTCGRPPAGCRRAASPWSAL